MNRIQRAAEVLGWPKSQSVRTRVIQTISVLIGVSGILINSGAALATSLTNSSVSLSDPRPAATAVSYTFKGSSVTSTNIKCIKAVISDSASSDHAPAGFSGATASVSASSTLTNGATWTLTTSDGTTSTGQKNIIKYTDATGVTPTTLTGATFIVTGLVNPSTADTKYWYFLSTYSDATCTTAVDSSTVQFINTNGSTLSLTVDTTLSFTVNAVPSGQSCNGVNSTQASTATTIPFGTVSAAANSIVCQDLTAATNATNGYTIYTRYTAKPTNALSQTIADWTGSNTTPTTFSAAGTEAYGYTTDDATLGTGTANRFTSGGPKFAAETTSNAEVAYEAAGVTSTTYRIGHEVGVSLTTKPGTYTTTIIYTCTPVY